MGLDMYLTRKSYIKNWDHNKEPIHKITKDSFSKEFQYIDPSKIKYIEEEVGYWRKANQIHNWFVENIQDGVDNCKRYYVNQEQLKSLLSICERIIEECSLIDGEVKNGYHYEGTEKVYNIESGKVMTNIELAKELLPAVDGFCFGGTEYDQWYYKDILNTIEIIKPLIEENKGDIYYSSFW